MGKLLWGSVLATVGIAVVAVVGMRAFAPAELTAHDAARRYLNVACPADAQIRAVDDAVANGDIAAVKEAAERARDLSRTAAVNLGDDRIAWPAGVAGDVGDLTRVYFAAMRPYDALSHAPSRNGMYEIVLPGRPGDSVPALRLRAALGLPADIGAACEADSAHT